ncbi:MAG: alpha/beta hydrolase [Bacilli bacterium]|nr:alpha/beta hydrolase [Bacilli bacterium]
MKKALRNTLIIIGTTTLVLTGAFFGYCAVFYHADEYALSFLDSDDVIEITKNGGDYIFTPKAGTDKCFIFYPGGKVENKAYAPLCNMIAHSGIKTILVSVPLNLAFFKIDAAKQYINEDNCHYYLGGHSLGGVAASSYVSSNYSSISGLVLLGSYCTSNLSDKKFKTLSITATNDKVMNWENYKKYKSNLPNLSEISIEGGIHSYFGSYGDQKGDGEAEIDKEEQTKLVSSYITEFMMNS